MLKTFDGDKEALSSRAVPHVAANATIWSLNIILVNKADVDDNKGKL